jgi:hypothetical protein
MGYEVLYNGKQCRRYGTAFSLHFHGSLKRAKTANRKVETVIISERFLFSYQRI